MKVFWGQINWAPVTAAFVVVEDRLLMCISQFEVTDNKDYFLSSTNTTQWAHLLESFSAGAHILFYESQIKKRFATIAAVNTMQNTLTHLHQKSEVATSGNSVASINQTTHFNRLHCCPLSFRLRLISTRSYLSKIVYVIRELTLCLQFVASR